MRFTALHDWLEWLQQSHPSAIDLGLERVGAVAQKLGLLGGTPTIITVAGTNGKGSCVAAMEQILLQAGRRVGAYTSPHLQHYCERIRLQGQPVSEQRVCRAFARIDAARGDISLTYFEFGTLAAVDIFMAPGAGLQPPEILLLEVGLGGRLDAVNLWDADIAVVTSIALDHQAWLGDTRELIGREKAGVFRAGRPAICADAAAPASIAETAAKVGAELQLVGRDFDFQPGGDSWSFRGRDARGNAVQLEGLALPGLPLPSVAAGLQALYGLPQPPPAADIRAVLPRLTLAGRLQTLVYGGVQLVLDVAHNPAAAAYLGRRLRQMPAAAPTCAVLAMMADKDIAACTEALNTVIEHWFVAGLEDMPRAASAAHLQQVLSGQGARARACDTVADAFAGAVARAGPGGRVVVLGSFLTVAAVLEICRGGG